MDGGALIAMSGGVDSSVAAFLSVERGLDCVGGTMRLFDNPDIGESRENACCSLKDAEDARRVAEKLGFPFYVFNFTDTFKERVIDRFVRAYQNGETPNPCIDCNRFLKFERLLRRAGELDRKYVVTGHYARIEFVGGRYLLKKAVDLSKDQSYVLYALTREQLARTLFPLGELTKTEVREIAREQGFANANKRDSQDICFVPNGDYAEFIRRYTGAKPLGGDFTDLNGNVIGRHGGIANYTVGQRKGLGLTAAAPLYVCAVNAADNIVTVGTQDALYSKVFFARDINLIAADRLDGGVRLGAKIRYGQREQPATAWQVDSDTIRVEFDKPQRAITRGQAAVLYDGDIVIGGGTING